MAKLKKAIARTIPNDFTLWGAPGIATLLSLGFLCLAVAAILPA